MTATMRRLYLAGPEVFFANGSALIARKKELALQYGFEPYDSDTQPHPEDRVEIGHFIFAMNDAAMRACDFTIANITPFRGISADVGTVYELGFMIAQGKTAFAYSNDPRHYGERANADYYRGTVAYSDEGLLRAHDGQLVEDHLMADNLMIDGGVAMSGGSVTRPASGPVLQPDDLSQYEACLVTAWKHFNTAIR